MPLNHESQNERLTDAQFAAIGKLVVEWSNIEFLLRLLLTRLLLTPAFPGWTFIDRLDVSRVQDAIEEAIPLHAHRYQHGILSEQVLDEISELNKRIVNLRTTRNKFAHFCWSRTTDDEIFWVNLTARLPGKKPDKRFVALTLVEINSFYTER